MGMLLQYHRNKAYAEAEQAGEPIGDAPTWDDLTDEQVAEAYVTNVGGNATSRRGQIKALRKLDDETSAPAEGTEDETEAGQPDPENPGSDPADEPGQPDPENDPEDADESDPEGE